MERHDESDIHATNDQVNKVEAENEVADQLDVDADLDSEKVKNLNDESGDERPSLKLKEENLTEESEEEGFKARYYYLAAEMENQKKRFQREKENIHKFSNENILKEILEVFDNFDRTLSMLKIDEDPKVKNIVFGIEMIQKQFNDKLKNFGLEVVESLGKEFDPAIHEAMSAEYREEEDEQQILKVLQGGYKLNGRLLRPAKVVVSTKEKKES